MSFINHKGTEGRKTAIIVTAAIQAVVGVVLVTGLSTVILDVPVQKKLEATNTRIKLPPPPPPPETAPDVNDPVPTTPQVYTPPTRVNINDSTFKFDTTSVLPDITDFVLVTPGPIGNDFVVPTPELTPKPAFDPVGAKPSNNPGDWISTSDYRTSWINRGMTGSGRFTLSVSASGRVQDCRVVSTTGHSLLDDATCRLMTSRARFNSARNNKNEKVAGEFTTSIKWVLPD